MRDLDTLVDLYSTDAKRMSARFSEMRLFDDYIAGRLPVALPELDKQEQSSIAVLAAQGLVGLAERVGSVDSDTEWPPVDPDQPESRARARKRKMAHAGWQEQSAMAELRTLRAEYLLGHAIGPVSVLPNFRTRVPEWRAENPLAVLPGAVANPLDVLPPYSFVVKEVTWGWLRKRYEAASAMLRRPSGCKDSQPFLHVRYVDDEQICSFAVAIDQHGDVWGSSWNDGVYHDHGGTGLDKACLLERVENRADMPLIFCPTLFGIGGQRGKFVDTIGPHRMRAKIAALALITAAKGASPDPWIESGPGGEDPEILEHPDPREGTPGLVKGRIRTIDVQPATVALQAMSILEREVRLSGGIPAALTGEAPTTVQTGRLSAGLLANAIDFSIQKIHRKYERCEAEENRAAVAIAKGWLGGKQSFYVGWGRAKGHVDYDPQADFETDRNIVRYPLAGSDLNNVMLRAQQMAATELVSEDTARRMNPEIPDPELEGDKVMAQRFEKALLAKVMQKIDDPASGWNEMHLVELQEMVGTDKKSLGQAMREIEERVKAEQAPPEAPPEMVEQMPGMQALPDMGMPEAPPGLARLASIVSQSRSTAAA